MIYIVILLLSVSVFASEELKIDPACWTAARAVMTQHLKSPIEKENPTIKNDDEDLAFRKTLNDSGKLEKSEVDILMTTLNKYPSFGQTHVKSTILHYLGLKGVPDFQKLMQCLKKNNLLKNFADRVKSFS